MVLAGQGGLLWVVDGCRGFSMVVVVVVGCPWLLRVVDGCCGC